jgi:putative acetyltransferase
MNLGPNTAVGPKTAVDIVEVTRDADIEAARVLVEEYARSLDFSLCFQDFDTEMKDFPGAYASPDGCLLVAIASGAPAGVVALRPLGDPDARTCEMKRLYVRPAYRRLKVGRLLVENLVEFARRRGYSRLRLDTHPSMTAARGIYRDMGFRRIANYNASTLDGIEHFELLLAVGVPG